MRHCKKVGCAREAVATCAFNYPDRHVWIGPLAYDPEPGSYDLCEAHAQRFVAPIGWELTDLRASLRAAG